MKRKVMVPCSFIYEDSEGRESLCKPTHGCNGNCSSCVWNSEEEKQHLVLKYPVLSSVKCIFDDLEDIDPEEEADAIVEKMLLIPLIDFFFQEGCES